MDLKDKIVCNLLCMHCLKEQIEGTQSVSDICLNDAIVHAVTANVGFTCTLSVTCCHVQHNFTIEPVRVLPSSSPDPIVIEDTMNDSHSSTQLTTSSGNGDMSTITNNTKETTSKDVIMPQEEYTVQDEAATLNTLVEVQMSHFNPIHGKCAFPPSYS